MLTPLVTGAVTGLALIVAIGAQNAYLLRQGLRREHVLTVVLICMGGDLVLITAGVAGVGTALQELGWLMEALRWAGAAYLVWFAISSFRSALHPGALGEQAPRSKGSVAATAAAVTFLNPHVYLDCVLLHGSVSSRFGDDRWVYLVGALTASALWFFGLGYAARALAGPLGRPSTWRVVDLLVGLTMLVVAAGLVFSG